MRSPPLADALEAPSVAYALVLARCHPCCRTDEGNTELWRSRWALRMEMGRLRRIIIDLAGIYNASCLRRDCSSELEILVLL